MIDAVDHRLGLWYGYALHERRYEPISPDVVRPRDAVINRLNVLCGRWARTAAAAGAVVLGPLRLVSAEPARPRGGERRRGAFVRDYTPARLMTGGSQPIPAYVAFGANLGDRARTIGKALEQLSADPRIEVRKVSSLLENAAVGRPADSLWP